MTQVLSAEGEMWTFEVQIMLLMIMIVTVKVMEISNVIFSGI